MNESQPTLSMIAGIGKNRELGRDNQLLWDIKEDMQRVRELTTGHTLIMGQKTYESIGRPLPKRVSIVLTHDEDFQARDVTVVHSSQEALEVAREKEQNGEIFIFGGASVYKLFLPQVDRLYLTVVDHAFDADVFFPEYKERFRIVKEEKSHDENYSYTFLVLEPNK